MSRQTKARKAEIEAAREKLRELLPKGSRVYCILQHVSRSGMRRVIKFYTIKDNEPYYLSSLISDALDMPFDSKLGGVKVDGCGMDMGFHVVHSLSYALHGMSNHDAKGHERSGYTLKHDWM